jgi:hypothetical protein
VTIRASRDATNKVSTIGLCWWSGRAKGQNIPLSPGVTTSRWPSAGLWPGPFQTNSPLRLRLHETAGSTRSGESSREPSPRWDAARWSGRLCLSARSGFAGRFAVRSFDDTNE